MRQSKLFTKTRKEAPKDEVSKNAQLLIRAGYIHKEMAGVYSFLPLGVRVMDNIKNIIRDEMNVIGGQEVFMSSLQDPELWKKTDRWNDEVVDVWFKSKLKAGGDIGFAWTHEEMITRIMSEYIRSYKDLPLYTYHIQNKFRNEVRAKSGIMRTREFFMKDLYSFSRTQEEHDKFYAESAETYMRVFNRLGIGDKTYKTFASGGAFTKFSHEFQTLSEAGEDIIYINEEKGIAVNEEVLADADLSELGVTREELEKRKSIEVGNIFSLGTKFSEALGLKYVDEAGEEKPIIMGSYGIGPARAMGTVVELLSDDKGIVWPEEVAPFKIHLVEIGGGDEKVQVYADELYKKFADTGIDVLYDDRDARAGEKFADSDLLGIPTRVVISKKTLEGGADNNSGNNIERVDRKTGKVEMVSEAELFS